MGVYCVRCSRIIHGGVDEFRIHLLDRIHIAPFRCNEEPCQMKTFSSSKSLIRHLRYDHVIIEDNLQPENAGALLLEDRGQNEIVDVEVGRVLQEARVQPEQDLLADSHDSVDDDTNSAAEEQEQEQLCDLNKKFERSVAQLTLRLWRKGNVTGTAIESVVEETGKLIADVVKALKDAIERNLKSAHVEDRIIAECVHNVVVQDPTQHLKNKEQQMKYYTTHFGLVKPTPIFLGHRNDQRLDPVTNTYVETQVPVSYTSMGLIETLTSVLNEPVWFEQIHEEKASTDGYIRSFLDGTEVNENDLIKLHPHTLRIVLNADEFECVNPLGSRVIVHKLMGVYYLIQNLPVEENSRLRAIHVACYGYSADFKPEEGVDTILKEFFEDLAKLESDEGVLIQVRGRPYVLRATLIAVAADTLGAHQLLGLLGPSASLFCRFCTVRRSDMHQNIFAMGEDRTVQLHERHVQDVAANGLAATKRTGVQRDCLLRQKCRFAKVPKLALFDGMHDALKGVCAMEIKLALHEFCVKRKCLNVDTLNARIQSFQYGKQDIKNKPSANFSLPGLMKLGGYTISQTAAQTWCLLRVFSFLVVPDVPTDDPHLKMISLLKRITEVIFSAAVSENDIKRLENLLKEHHQLFMTLYPPTEPAPEAQGDQEDDTEAVGDEMEESDEDDPPSQESEATEQQQEDPTHENHESRRKKKKKKVRPINKHHQLLHYPEMIRRYGAAFYYWCMR